MKKHQREAILISFLNEKAGYKKLAEYIVHLVSDDPSSPKESLHINSYRIRDELRIIEKIDKQNKALEAGAPPRQKSFVAVADTAVAGVDDAMAEVDTAVTEEDEDVSDEDQFKRQ
jgi:hypothetical protein